ILHPEKYFSYERPTKVVLPDVTSLLNAAASNQQSASSTQPPAGTAGASPALGRARSSSQRPRGNRPLSALHTQSPTAHRPLPTSSWHRIESDVNGVCNYYLILDQFLSAPAETKRAPTGRVGAAGAGDEG